MTQPTSPPQPPSAPPVATAPSPPPTAPMYPPPPGYGYAPPPRPDNTLKIVLIVVVVLVVIAVLAVILLTGFLASLFGGPTFTKPTVTFENVVVGTDTATITVATMSAGTSAVLFQVNLEVAGVSGDAKTMPIRSGSLYAVEITIGSTTYSITWNDATSNNLLSVGDSFTVGVATGSWPSGSTMTFHLLWFDLSTIRDATWHA